MSETKQTPDPGAESDFVALRASFNSDVEPKSGRIMFAPAGDHTIHCGLGDRAGAIVTVRVDRSTAAVLNASLAKLNQAFAPQRALFDAHHEGKEAMAWPTGFEWSELPKPGVYALAEYSVLGAEYVQGKVLRCFSGEFFTDADLPKRKDIKADQVYTPKPGKRGSEDNPARMTALNFPFCGTLTNNPAFHENLPLWAKHQGPGAGQERALNTKQRDWILRNQRKP